ncbi:MAG: hypothetical protein M1503_04585 [Thaumarchaeota archaeon]|nr:hypothetical protein [Nitrososphaerota archaeon]MCL5317527.1 hypothetical protein [Nitrososphaerota archaeon]
MGRYLALMGIWFAGFALGFIGYLSYPTLSELAVTALPFLMNVNNQIIGALVAGVASSLITILAVSIWAYASRPNSL